MTTYAAVFISANSFKIEDGDYTNFFHVSERVQATCDGENFHSAITSSTFDSTDTIIEIEDSVLTDGLTVVERGGIWAGVTGNVPPHDHSTQYLGGTGVKGGPAVYEWSGTQIRFKNSDGTWGSWVDLGGTDGNVWFTGVDDPPPAGTGEDGDFYLVLESAS